MDGIADIDGMVDGFTLGIFDVVGIMDREGGILGCLDGIADIDGMVDGFTLGIFEMVGIVDGRIDGRLFEDGTRLLVGSTDGNNLDGAILDTVVVDGGL